ncbi:MAG TPA: hypothetical protein VIM75_10615 [Ohtaekwangia sp.]|uniref:hypothetical protein n=1 Tax=Ohtaekwangia sp. TaxID=2066019 RepID=UPI002F921F1C
MAYTFKNTEINNEKASNFETKSLLYLIGKSNDRKQIEYVTFDCFNDVSGVNKSHDKIWDIQSKNEKALSPKKIGEYFFTLFDNYISGFSFKEFIFFCPVLKSSYKVDGSLRNYKTSNIQPGTLIRIKKGLTEEVERVKGKTVDYTSKISSFISMITIVESDETENEYIKSITKFKRIDLKTDDFYKSVFNDLRNIQTTKKNTCIENVTITEIREVLLFNRHLPVKDIELLVISRIIGCNIFDFKAIPLYFSPFTDGKDIEDKKDILQECNSNLSRAFFNKNSNRVFWEICEELLTFFAANTSKDVQFVYDTVFSSYRPRLSYLDELTLKYLISIILEGLE